MSDTRAPYVLFTRGIPGSGKSTWARQVADQAPVGQVKLISLDDLRHTVDRGHAFNGQMGRADEKIVQHLQDELVCEAVSLGRDVIVHNTHGFAKTPNRIRRLVALEAELAVVDFTDVNRDVCVERDRTRDRTVGETVIDRMVSDMRKGVGGFREWDKHTPEVAAKMILAGRPSAVRFDQATVDPGLPWACIVDLDGTLAKHNGRDPYDGASCGSDLLDESVAAAAASFPNVIYCSGREETHRDVTVAWLRRELEGAEDRLGKGAVDRLLDAPLYMRPSGDTRPDTVVKKEIFDDVIRGRFNVAVAFDDRDSVVRMWRKLGLTVWQVAEGRF